MEQKRHCYTCVYRRNIPGNAHIECSRIFGDIPEPKLDPYGVKRGWCFWPVNFDPTWVGPCAGYSETEDPKKVRDEWGALFSLLRWMA